MKVIDLRSDTVTQPTDAMREAMRQAEVGDDGWGEDPTVNRLEAMAAEVMGKERALFTASGTMSNLLAVLTHCQRGDEVILGDESHMFSYEVGGSSTVAGVHIHILPNNKRGMLEPEEVEACFRPPDIHFAPIGLVCLENTHNRCCGAALSAEDTKKVAEVATRHMTPLHLDGARIFNAAVSLGVEARELTRDATSVSFSLCKGLAAPVGSMLSGDAEFVERARKYRKMLGGGMRQAGIIAAAGIVALETMVERLTEDHRNAKVLAEGLCNINGLIIDPETVRTNIVIFELINGSPERFVTRLAERGVKAVPFGGRRVRMVTHYGIELEDIKTALDIISSVVKEVAR